VKIGTPLTYRHYLRSENGAVYGLDHDARRFNAENFYLRLRPAVPEVRGLFLAGQDVATDSLVGAMTGGLLCAQKAAGVTKPASLIRRTSRREMVSKQRPRQEQATPSAGRPPQQE